MEIYLCIITTALVLTQIIRLCQNARQLKYLTRAKNKEAEVMQKWEQMASAIDRLAKGE